MAYPEPLERLVEAFGRLPGIGRRTAERLAFHVPPGVANYQSMQFRYAQLTLEERHAEARRLFAEAGFGDDNPLQIEIRYNTSETHRRVAVAVQAMWREVLGVVVDDTGA